MKTKRYFEAGIKALGLCALAAAQALTAAPAPDRLAGPQGELVVRPLNHATLALEWKGQAIVVDPVGPAGRFTGLPPAGLIVVTDIHGDHLGVDVIKLLLTDKTRLVAPPAVGAQLPAELAARATLLTNGQAATVNDVPIEAVAAYNLAPERQKFHAKGRGNGYVLTLGERRVYVSGDTEDTPEMRALTNIDVAFLCMNLPYTMTVEQAAGAVRAFRPKVVYPYHCRGSDLNKFKELLADVPGVEVRLRDWYQP